MKNLILISILIIVGCNKSDSRNGANSNKVNIDTLFVNEVFTEVDSSCWHLFNEYYKRFGISIAKYYMVDDSLPIDLNGDKQMDTLVVFSPVSLELADKASCIRNSTPKRILVEIINLNGESSIRNTYNNLISNVGGVLSPFNGITKTESGFVIKHQAGSKYSWEYSMEFIPNENKDLKFVKITKVCSYDGVAKQIEYNNGLDVRKINIQDTLDLNCGCDTLWQDLEKQ